MTGYIKASYLNSSSGTSKRTGSVWCRLQTVVMVNDSLAVPFEVFVDEAVYAKVCNCKPKQNIALKAGVNSFGKLCIVDVLVEPEAR